MKLIGLLDMMGDLHTNFGLRALDYPSYIEHARHEMALLETTHGS